MTPDFLDWDLLLQLSTVLLVGAFWYRDGLKAGRRQGAKEAIAEMADLLREAREAGRRGRR